MKDSPMLLVKKDVLYCGGDVAPNSDTNSCLGEDLLRPDSNRYVQECDNEFQEICDSINESSFNIVVTDDIEFLGSEKRYKTKL